MHYELSNEMLTQKIDHLVQNDRRLTVCLLDYLGEFEARGIHAAMGYTSMFCYLVERLKYSEGSAARRVASARILRRFPWIGKKIEDGSLHLTTLHLVAAHLCGDDAEELLRSVCSKSKSEVSEILAKRSGSSAPKREIIRMFISPNLMILPGNSSASPVEVEPQNKFPLASVAIVTNLDEKPVFAEKKSIDQKEVRLTISIDAETYEKLLRAKVVTGSKDIAMTLKRAIGKFLEKNDPSRRMAKVVPKKPKPAQTKGINTTSPPLGLEASPSKAPQSSPVESRPSRYVPEAIKAAVVMRDGEGCSFEHAGRRCNSIVSLEFDHRVPLAKGGTTTVENIRKLCRTHNLFCAKQEFGKGFIERKIAERRGKMRA